MEDSESSSWLDACEEQLASELLAQLDQEDSALRALHLELLASAAPCHLAIAGKLAFFDEPRQSESALCDIQRLQQANTKLEQECALLRQQVHCVTQRAKKVKFCRHPHGLERRCLVALHFSAFPPGVELYRACASVLKQQHTSQQS